MLSLFFLFKQKTAYEMRISDWSSDVCSSDLFVTNAPHLDNALGHLHIDAARGPLDAKGGADRPDTHIANLDNEGPRAILGDLKPRFTVVERDLADLRIHRNVQRGLRVYRGQRTNAQRDPPAIGRAHV